MRLVPASEQNRNALWSKEAVLYDLATSRLSLRKICQRYAPSPDKWRGYYADIWKWGKLDKAFKMAVEKHKARVGSQKRKSPGGRPPKDNGDKTWQQSFCEALVRFDGNREKASSATPYEFSTILQKLDKEYSSYDEQFAKMVRATELKLAARAEELMFSSLREECYEDMEKAKITQTKVWVADKVLSRMDASRWGRSVEMHVSGNVDHKHTHGILAGKREEVLSRLVNEQQEFMRSKMLSLPAPASAVPDVVDAEVVNGSVDSRDS